MPNMGMKAKIRPQDSDVHEFRLFINCEHYKLMNNRRVLHRERANLLTPPLLIYADLVATADARNIETAQIIRERFLAKI